MLWGVKEHFAFMGKSSLGKIPFIGYMYTRLNILVDRKSIKSKANAYNQAMMELDNGKSLVIFSEGTISTVAPYPGHFKDGAFRIAIEKQIPIVPVTIPYNWLILPDDGKWAGRPHFAMAIFHEPIITKGLTLDDIKWLMDKTHQIISDEVYKRNPHVNR